MQNLLKRGVMSILGVVVMLAWWSFRGSDANTESADKIPVKVWDGGAGTMTIEAESTSAARMRVSFSEEEKEDGRSLETYEDVPAGSHSWTINVPAGTGGYVELGAVDPKPGDKLTWKVSVNGRVVSEQAETLAQPLEKNTAFFLQSYFADYATGTLSED
jgi:hypothetical protein